MLLVYSHITSSRLQYTVGYLCNELLGIPCRITIDPEEFNQYDGPKINYSNRQLTGTAYWIVPQGLLHEEGIKEQNITVSHINGLPAFFATDTGDAGFDILAASFYLLSRYEEYRPHTLDEYGRYAHQNSIAFTNNFLHLPLINCWVQQLAQQWQQRWPNLPIKPAAYSFLPTYDIDIAYSYRYKGFVRTVGGALQNPATMLQRAAVLLFGKKDPFNSYNTLHQLHEQYHLHPRYFFLVAAKNGVYDKNILPHKKAMWSLVSKHARRYHIGIHPSWQSGDTPALLLQEMTQLAEMAEQTITHSRQHYIRFTLPQGYKHLLEAGITDDYSMGYGSINGFRASVAQPFYWYDLHEEKATALRLHPFCYMDANCYYEQRQSPAEALAELQQYHQTCKQVGGELCTIWHNNFLGTDKAFAGWRDVYQQFLIINHYQIY